MLAVQMNITLASGIVVENAYIKITYYQGSSSIATVFLSAFKDRDAMINNFPKIDGYSPNYSFTPETGQNVGDILTQGYSYIKTKPEFENAIDILEN